MSIMLTINQLQTLIQIEGQEDIYLGIESKDENDLSSIKVNFFNENDEKSQDYFINMDGDQIGEDEY